MTHQRQSCRLLQRQQIQSRRIDNLLMITWFQFVFLTLPKEATDIPAALLTAVSDVSNTKRLNPLSPPIPNFRPVFCVLQSPERLCVPFGTIHALALTLTFPGLQHHEIHDKSHNPKANRPGSRRSQSIVVRRWRQFR